MGSGKAKEMKTNKGEQRVEGKEQRTIGRGRPLRLPVTSGRSQGVAPAFSVSLFFFFCSLFSILFTGTAFATTLNLASNMAASKVTVNGTLATKGYDLDVGTGGVVVGASAVLNLTRVGAPDGTQINVEGNWDNSAGGTFTASTDSTIVFDGSGTSQILGTNSFYNFKCQTAAKTLRFKSGLTTTVSGLLTLTGGVGAQNYIAMNRLASDSSGQWSINPATFSVDKVNVSNSNNTSGASITATSYTDGGNNVGWFIGGTGTTAVTPASLVAGAVGNVTVSFTNQNAIPANGDVQVTFPSGFALSSGSASTASSAANITGVLTASVSGQVLTVNLGSGLAAGTTVSDLVITNIKNPTVSGATGTFPLETQGATDAKIDEGTAAAVTITPGALSSANVQPASVYMSATGNVTVTFTTANPIPADGKIVVTFPTSLGSAPAGFVINSGGTTAATSSTMDGVLSVGVASNVVTVTRSGGAEQAAGQTETITLTYIKNPNLPGSTGTYSVETKNSADTLIDRNLAVTADTISGGVTVTLGSAVTSASTYADIDFPISQALPADGKILVQFDPDFILTSITSSSAAILYSSLDGSLSTSPPSGNIVTITRNGGTEKSSGSFKIRISNITTPSSAQYTDSFLITTKTAGGTQLDSGYATGVQITSSNALSNCSVNLSSLAASATGVQADIYFTPGTTWPADGKFSIAFPSTFTLTSVGAGDVSSPDTSIDGTLTIANAAALQSGSTKTVQVSRSGNAISGGQLFLTIRNVINPSSAGHTADYSLATLQSNGTSINTGTAPGNDIAGSGSALSNVSVSLNNSATGATSTATVSFKTAGDAPNGGKIKVGFDQQFNLSSVVLSSVAFTSGVTGGATNVGTDSNKVVTITIGSISNCPAGGGTACTFTIANIVNPLNAMTTASYAISTWQSNGTTIINSGTASGSAIGVSGVQWLGGTSNSWHTATNWQGGVVPATTDTVVINGKAASGTCQPAPNDFTSGGAMGCSPRISQAVTINKLYIGQSTASKLKIAANLTVTTEIKIYDAPSNYNEWAPPGSTTMDPSSFHIGSEIIVEGNRTAVNGGSADRPWGAPAGFLKTHKLDNGAGGRVHANGEGFQPIAGSVTYAGPGTPTLTGDQLPGSSGPGGVGGFAPPRFPPPPYGPGEGCKVLGSAGINKSGSELGGPGGGAVWIILTAAGSEAGQLILNRGAIEANGLGGIASGGGTYADGGNYGTCSGYQGCGTAGSGGAGGSGGIILIDKENTSDPSPGLTGTGGMFFANAGFSFAGATAGSGGGCIDIRALSPAQNFDVFANAMGGPGYLVGSPGRIYWPVYDLVIKSGQFFELGADSYTFSSVTIQGGTPGGKLKLKVNPFDSTKIPTVTVTGNFTIDSGGTLDCSAGGFMPGFGSFNDFSGSNTTGGSTYGSNAIMGHQVASGGYSAPVAAGMGAPAFDTTNYVVQFPPSATAFSRTDFNNFVMKVAPGGMTNGAGAGGGAVKIVAANGTFTNNGTVQCGGGTAFMNGLPGGAGGTVYVKASTVTGSGDYDVSGGAGGPSGGGGGGGGAILFDSVSTFTPTGDFNTAGGAGNGGLSGLAGYIKFPSSVDITVPANKTWTLGFGDYSFPNLTVNGILKVGCDPVSGAGGTFTITNNLTIAATGNMNADACVSPQYGTGKGDYNPNTGYSDPIGGSYGGGAGLPSNNAQRTSSTYGSAAQPSVLGSGGGGLQNAGSGGGYIKISGPSGQAGSLAVTVNGNLSANGGNFTSGQVGAGGSGGSIWILANTLAGSGTIEAKAGSGSITAGGAGGGRVAYHVRTNTFTSAGFSVAGGSSANPGDAGSLFGNSAPSVSSLGSTALVDGSYSSDSTPTFTFTLSDSDTPAQTVKYRIEIDDSSDFSSLIVDYTSALQTQGTGTFTVGQAAGSGTYDTGSASTTLSDTQVGYYWRVLPIDEYDMSAASWATANSGSVAFKVNTTAATAAFTNSSGTDKSSYAIADTSDKIFATVTDIDQNTNTGSQQTVTVTVTDSVSGDSESLTLTETGNDTHIFRNSTGLTTALYDGSKTNDDSTFETTGSSTITVTYTDGSTDRTDTATTSITATNATVVISDSSTGTTAVSSLTIGSGVYFYLTDADQNTNGASIQSVTITVAGESAKINDSVTVTLTETGANTGLFRNSTALATATGAASDLPTATLHVKNGEIITATYTDNSSVSRTATATMAIASSDATVKLTNSDGSSELSTYKIGTDLIFAYVTDSDINKDGTTAETLSVTLSNASTGDSLTQTLTETGVNTGIFINSTGIASELASTATTTDTKIQTRDGETLTLTYTDSPTASGSSASRTATATMSTAAAAATVQLVDSAGSDAASYTIGTDKVYIKITATGQNKNTVAEDTVTATLSNPTLGYSVAGTGDTMTLTLTESGVSTGVFQYEVSGVVTGISLEVASASTADTVLQVVSQSTVVLSYTDATTSVVTKDTAGAVAAAGTSTTAITSSSGADVEKLYIGTDSIYIQVTDSDENTNPSEKETVTATVTTTGTTDSEAVTLTETGNNTGIFRSSGLTLALAAEKVSNNNATLETESGATVTASYADNDTSSDTSLDTVLVERAATTSSTSFTNSSGSDVNSYTSTKDLVYVTVIDSDRNKVGTVRENIQVEILSSISGDRETVVLEETMENTGYFRNTNGLRTKISSSSSINDGTLQVSAKGDTLTATYTDDDDSTDITTDTATIGSVSFRVKAGALTQIAGTEFALTIEALDGADGVGNTLSTYSGTVEFSITYVDPNSGADTIFPSSTSNFSEGVSVLMVSYPNAGVITVSATDTLDSDMTGVSGQISFYPASFSVAAASTIQTVNEPFLLTVKALNSKGVVTSNYNKGTVNLTRENVSPSTVGGTFTPASVGVVSEFANGVAMIQSANFDEWGSIKIVATDSERSNVTGKSEAISFLPKKLSLDIAKAPASRDFFYLNEEFKVTLQTLDAKSNTIPNYGGKVAFALSGGAAVTPAEYTFVPSADGGKHVFNAVASKEGSYTLNAQDSASTSVAGKSSEFQIKYGKVWVERQVRAPVGSVKVPVKVIDRNGSILTQDDSTTVSVVLSEEKSNDSASISETTITLKSGRGEFEVSDTEAEVVTLTPTSSPKLDASPGSVTFGKIGEGITIEYWLERKESKDRQPSRG